MTNPADLMAPAREAMRIALDIVRDSTPGHLTVKGDRDVASEVDVRIEEQLREFLARETSEVGFLGEERGGADLGGPTWVLDPIDGTANYVHGLPVFAISLALVQNDQPSLGLVSMPAMDLHYTALSGSGALCNEQRIKTSKISELHSALFSFGDFAVGPDAESSNTRRYEMLNILVQNVERVRMIGSAAADLVWVAEGRLDACILLSNQPWDVAAGLAIANEAGAVIQSANGGEHLLSVPGTVASAPDLAPYVRELLHSVK